jgi:phage terminase large subunit-like protein
VEWTTACPDWEKRLIAGESIIPPPIFPDQAEQALAIFKELRVVDLPGKPTFGECSEQWVFDFVAAIFGALRRGDGQAADPRVLPADQQEEHEVTIAAGIMLTAVILCWREEEEHLILAPTKEVADNSFKPAAGWCGLTRSFRRCSTSRTTSARSRTA